MAETVRFGISIDERLLNRFDTLIDEKGYSNRSEAIRDLIRNALVEEEWAKENQETIGTVSLVYDHHTRDLSDKLTEHQHSHRLSTNRPGYGGPGIDRQIGCRDVVEYQCTELRKRLFITGECARPDLRDRPATCCKAFTDR